MSNSLFAGLGFCVTALLVISVLACVYTKPRVPVSGGTKQQYVIESKFVETGYEEVQVADATRSAIELFVHRSRVLMELEEVCIPHVRLSRAISDGTSTTYLVDVDMSDAQVAVKEVNGERVAGVCSNKYGSDLPILIYDIDYHADEDFYLEVQKDIGAAVCKAEVKSKSIVIDHKGNKYTYRR